MKQLFLLVLSGGLATVLWDCGSLRNEVNPAFLNNETAKVVVNGFLSPQDTVLAIKLTRSQTVLGDSVGTVVYGDDIPNATVTVSTGDRSVQLTYSARLGYYRASVSQFPIVAGQTYRLVVQTPSGYRAESSCSIPGPVAIETVALDSTADTRLNRFGARRFYTTIRWRDPVGIPNFYQLRGLFQFVGNCTTCPEYASGAPRLITTTTRFDAGSVGLTTDAEVDGSLILSPRAYLTGWRNYVNNPDGSFPTLFKTANIRMDLLNVEQTYYRYQNAIQRQSQTGGNPFAEPVLIPSNIQGGLGCFAGYNQSSITARLK